MHKNNAQLMFQYCYKLVMSDICVFERLVLWCMSICQVYLKFHLGYTVLFQEMDAGQAFNPFNTMSDIWGPNAPTTTSGWNIPPKTEEQ